MSASDAFRTHAACPLTTVGVGEDRTARLIHSEKGAFSIPAYVNQPFLGDGIDAEKSRSIAVIGGK